jgi:hypothetical protein
MACGVGGGSPGKIWPWIFDVGGERPTGIEHGDATFLVRLPIVR